MKNLTLVNEAKLTDPSISTNNLLVKSWGQCDSYKALLLKTRTLLMKQSTGGVLGVLWLFLPRQEKVALLLENWDSCDFPTRTSQKSINWILTDSHKSMHQSWEPGILVNEARHNHLTCQASISIDNWQLTQSWIDVALPTKTHKGELNFKENGSLIN